MRLPCDGKRLHRQDRQHAGHQIEDQAPDEREQKRDEQAAVCGVPEIDTRHRARLRIHAQRLHRAVGGGQHQHAGQCLRRLAVLRLGETQDQAIIRRAAQLRRHAIDDAFCRREEHRVLQLRLCERWRRDEEIEIVARAECHRPWRRHRNFRARGVELFLHRGVRRRRMGVHRQRQRQRRVFGDADFLAHQPVSGGFQGHDVARLRIGRRGDRGQQPDILFIAVIHQRPDRQALGIGPNDRAGFPAGG